MKKGDRLLRQAIASHDEPTYNLVQWCHGLVLG